MTLRRAMPKQSLTFLPSNTPCLSTWVRDKLFQAIGEILRIEDKARCLFDAAKSVILPDSFALLVRPFLAGARSTRHGQIFRSWQNIRIKRSSTYISDNNQKIGGRFEPFMTLMEAFEMGMEPTLKINITIYFSYDFKRERAPLLKLLPPIPRCKAAPDFDRAIEANRLDEIDFPHAAALASAGRSPSGIRSAAESGCPRDSAA